MDKSVKTLKLKHLASLLLITVILACSCILFTLPAVAAANPANLEKYDDVRAFNTMTARKDMHNMDLRQAGDIIPTLTFNTKTVWPSKMPEGISPKNIMEAAKNPGLGVKELHKQGYNGKGVTVAIIDQPLYQDHPEFAGKILKYKDFDCKSESSMHGPAVTSLLVGKNTGTAPGAGVYYAAAPSWLADAAYYAKALDWIIEENSKLPEASKIRAVSVSAAPSGQGSPFKKNNEMWDKSVANAEKAGILVLDCTQNHGIVSSCYLDANAPDDLSKCVAGYPGIASPIFSSNKICAPTSPRTTAEEYEKGDFGYQYNGRGGLSWAIPYCAGVLAMGWQVNPEMTSQEAVELLFKSAYKKDGSTSIIDPKAFINLVTAGSGKQAQ